MKNDDCDHKHDDDANVDVDVSHRIQNVRFDNIDVSPLT